MSRVKTFFLISFLLFLFLILEMIYLFYFQHQKQSLRLEVKTAFAAYVSFADLSFGNSPSYKRASNMSMFDIYGIDATLRENKKESFIYTLKSGSL